MVEFLARLHPSERLAALGAAAIPLSLAFPWYGIPVSGGLVQTGFGAFGFAHAALLLTTAAALYLLFRRLRGNAFPRPFSEGGLLAVAGGWGALLVGYLMLDRPDELAGFGRVNLRYGIFVALAGAVATMVGGLRLRQVDADTDLPRPDTRPGGPREPG